ncbi:MAG: sigma-70 family RNA polymerase sigma factor [Dehalococcoidia bacterium]
MRGSRAPSGEPEDVELVAALADEDIRALEQLYDRYSTLAYSVSLRVLRDPQLAEDVVQEVFLRLWRQPTSYDPTRGRFISWLMSVTRNRSVDELRRVSRRRRSEQLEEQPGHELASTERLDDPQAGVEIAEARANVRAAMTRLPPSQRRVIELAYFGGLTQVEIADVTGEPLGTVKTRIRLGMNKLREALGGYMEWEGGPRP